MYKGDNGTTIILTLKEDTDEEKYSQYLETYELKELIKKYSDYIRYPIKMNVETQKMKEGTEESEKPEYETVVEDQTLNSMVPLWKRQNRRLQMKNTINSTRIISMIIKILKSDSF